MVERLFERLIERGEQQLKLITSGDALPSLKALLDLLYGDLFSNSASNVVVSELWSLARRNDGIQTRLRGLYQTIIDVLVDAMKADGLGTTQAERRNAAFCLISLAYGHASFREIALTARKKSAPRLMADVILTSLK